MQGPIHGWRTPQVLLAEALGSCRLFPLFSHLIIPAMRAGFVGYFFIPVLLPINIHRNCQKPLFISELSLYYVWLCLMPRAMGSQFCPSHSGWVGESLSPDLRRIEQPMQTWLPHGWWEWLDHFCQPWMRPNLILSRNWGGCPKKSDNLPSGYLTYPWKISIFNR